MCDILVIENKLSATTPLTTPQSNAFTKNSFIVRSRSTESETNIAGQLLRSGDEMKFSGNRQCYKVHDGTNGDIISGINKMD